MITIDLAIPTGAIFSDDGDYRYALWRVWNPSRRPLMFIGLNPSTASKSMNDPTITRLMARADREGFGALLAGNLYAVVTSNPQPLLKEIEGSIGVETDEYLSQMVNMAGRVLCAWGSFPAVNERAAAILAIIPDPFCLGVNKDGNPKHPLYLPYDAEMVRYEKGN